MAKHLTDIERRDIAILRSVRRKSIGYIAQYLGRAKSTIATELKRNTRPGNLYRSGPAQTMAELRRKKPRVKRKMDDPAIVSHVQEKLFLKWSPEQIAGRLRRRGPSGLQVSHETIYKWIWQQKRLGANWHRHLRVMAKKKYRRRSGRETRGGIKNRVWIDDRPASVDTRRFFGDWEGDTIVGSGHRSCVTSMVERKSRYVCLALVQGHHPEPVTQAIIGRFKAAPGLPVNTITLDNGREFKRHGKLSEALSCTIYFAHPYHSWERGLNENTNGLVRQFYRKGTDFREVTEEDLARVEKLLNTRPRKVLGYRTPEEVFKKALIG